METKHPQEEWYDTFNNSKERGVRTKGGYICFMPKPTHYTGQDERYETELTEYKANAKLIAAAPDLLKALIKANKLLKERCLDTDIEFLELNIDEVINRATK